MSGAIGKSWASGYFKHRSNYYCNCKYLKVMFSTRQVPLMWSICWSNYKKFKDSVMSICFFKFMYVYIYTYPFIPWQQKAYNWISGTIFVHDKITVSISGHEMWSSLIPWIIFFVLSDNLSGKTFPDHLPLFPLLAQALGTLQRWCHSSSDSMWQLPSGFPEPLSVELQK